MRGTSVVPMDLWEVNRARHWELLASAFVSVNRSTSLCTFLYHFDCSAVFTRAHQWLAVRRRRYEQRTVVQLGHVNNKRDGVSDGQARERFRCLASVLLL